MPKKYELTVRYFYRNLICKRVDCYHTVNTVYRVPPTQKWCNTFETCLPRTEFVYAIDWSNLPSPSVKLDRVSQQEIACMAKPNCVSLMAMSQCALDYNRYVLAHMDIADSDRKAILAKMSVCHPPQDLLLTREKVLEKFSDVHETVKFVFVGNDFFRKGMPEFIEVLETFKDRYRFELLVVSGMNYQDWATKTKVEERDAWERRLEEIPWITFRHALPNDEVLELCKTAHIGLLPSFADSYGFSVLEQQACGCPVISSNIRALPEINPPECGWMVSLTKDPHSGEAIYADLEARRKEMREGLVPVLEEIFANRELIVQKGLASWERIKKHHDPADYEQKMLRVYNGKGLDE